MLHAYCYIVLWHSNVIQCYIYIIHVYPTIFHSIVLIKTTFIIQTNMCIFQHSNKNFQHPTNNFIRQNNFKISVNDMFFRKHSSHVACKMEDGIRVSKLFVVKRIHTCSDSRDTILGQPAVAFHR